MIKFSSAHHSIQSPLEAYKTPRMRDHHRAQQVSYKASLVDLICSLCAWSLKLRLKGISEQAILLSVADLSGS